MSQTVSIVTPAHRAETLLPEAVRSVLGQSFEDWELVIVSDDGVDYETLLRAHGLSDPRFRFLTSGAIGGGAARARNVALDRIETPYVAILDADDRFKPRKLERAVLALETWPIVSTGLDLRDEAYGRLRLVGDGPDRPLRPGAHKWVNISMDSMLVWDRRRCDARYDLELTNMTDLELLMQLYRTAGRSFHLGEPLHDYLKRGISMSNGPGVTETMIRSKRLLLSRLAAGLYPMADPAGPEGIAAFLEISLTAERTYPGALEARPGLLFEDHLEPLLRTASTSFL